MVGGATSTSTARATRALPMRTASSVISRFPASLARLGIPFPASASSAFWSDGWGWSMISSTRRSILSSSRCTGRVCFGLLITKHSSLQDLPSEVDELAFRRHPEDLGTCWHLHPAVLPVLTVATAPGSRNGGPSHL